MSEQSYFYTANELSSILGVSLSYSYRLISDMNSQLKEMGFITISGRIPKAYFNERFYLQEK